MKYTIEYLLYQKRNLKYVQKEQKSLYSIGQV